MKLNEKSSANTEICTFNKSLNVFDSSKDDISRTTHRFKMFSYDKDAKAPVLYRHYKHYHDDEVSISGYRTQKQNYYTLFIFVEGKIGLFVSETLYTSGLGKIVTLSPDEDYNLFIYALENLEYYEFDFPKEYFELIPKASPLHKIFLDKDFSGTEVKDKNAEKLFHLLSVIDKTIDSEDDYKDFCVYSLLMQASGLICNTFSGNNNSDSTLSPMLKNALKYISDNLTSLADTKQVADFCNISVSYLCRLFKNHLNTSPLEYINNQKLLRAKFLLKNGYNVTDSCFESGFDNYNYFITKFKNTVGMTPTEYQKSK